MSLVSNVEYSSTGSVYWCKASRTVTVRDIGHTCRECKLPFTQVGMTIAVRRGCRLELRYHTECISGDADPRSQPSSSFNIRGNGAFVSEQAPLGRFNKMKTSSHF